MPLSKETAERGPLGKLLKSQSEEAVLRNRTSEILKTEWARICARAEAKKLEDCLDNPSLIEVVKASVNSPTKTYRYVLPTQLLSKLADSSLDSRCVQASRGGVGTFDARTIAHKVIVPFDQQNESVLGASQEPYVSKPLRFPEISAAYRKAQKNKAGWDGLCLILNKVEERADENFTLQLFRQVLTEIYKRLSTVRIIYPTPRRVSLDKCVALIQVFLSEHSGGDRLLALTSALFAVIGRRFGLYNTIRRGKITAADEPSGMLADLECVAERGRIVLAVEVKDRQITVGQLKAKLRTIKERQVSEIFFVAQGAAQSEQPEIQSLIQREFTGGQNVYLTDLLTLSTVALSILGEEGRSNFLEEVRNQMETYKSEITHRRAWATLLESL